MDKMKLDMEQAERKNDLPVDVAELGELSWWEAADFTVVSMLSS